METIQDFVDNLSFIHWILIAMALYLLIFLKEVIKIVKYFITIMKEDNDQL